MAIQTEVNLQLDYTCCLRVMGKKSRIAEIVILSPSQRTRWSSLVCDNAALDAALHASRPAQYRKICVADY